MRLESEEEDFAVLLMAYGGPESLDDVSGFLSDIRRGRPLSPEFLSEVIERYRIIGGGSPLLSICQKLSNKLEEALGRRVYLGMRHWHPFIRDTVNKIARDGHRKILGICLAPHYSDMSILEYQKAVRAANDDVPRPMELRFVDSWAVQAEFVEYCVQEIVLAKEALGLEGWSKTSVFLTAHSLPESILEKNDPYVDQLALTKKAISERLGFNCDLVFQSASTSSVRWLGPSIEDELERIAGLGTKNVIVAPIGFVAEHVEILYDLDVVAKNRAKSLDLRFIRTAMLNDRPQMVAILMRIIEESASENRKSVVVEPVERSLA